MRLVSVVVATYKRETELQKALASLAIQSYSNIEIVLIDDNGNVEWNNRVSEIVHRFRDKFPMVSLNYIVNERNQGSAKTRNIGIAAASGEYITFLDDDDSSNIAGLMKMYDFAKKKEFDFVKGYLTVVDNGRQRIAHGMRQVRLLDYRSGSLQWGR